ncbi:MAG: hypothetical protein ACJ8GW_17045 [Massilia sp.]
MTSTSINRVSRLVSAFPLLLAAFALSFGASCAQAQVRSEVRLSPATGEEKMAAQIDKLTHRLDDLEAAQRQLVQKNESVAATLTQMAKKKLLTDDNVTVFQINATKSSGYASERKHRINHPYSNNNANALVFAVANNKQLSLRTEYENGYWWVVTSAIELTGLQGTRLKNCDGCGATDGVVALGGDATFSGTERFTILIFKGPHGLDG